MCTRNGPRHPILGETLRFIPESSPGIGGGGGESLHFVHTLIPCCPFFKCGTFFKSACRSEARSICPFRVYSQSCRYRILCRRCPPDTGTKSRAALDKPGTLGYSNCC